MWSLRWRWHLVYINDSVDDHWLDHGAEDIVDDIRRYADDAVISHIFDDNLDVYDAQQRDADSVCRHWRPSCDRGRRRHG